MGGNIYDVWWVCNLVCGVWGGSNTLPMGSGWLLLTLLCGCGTI